MADALEKKRQKIMEAQLKARGFTPEQVRQAISDAPDGIPALGTSGPNVTSPPTDSTELRRQKIMEAQLRSRGSDQGLASRLESAPPTTSIDASRAAPEVNLGWLLGLSSESTSTPTSAPHGSLPRSSARSNGSSSAPTSSGQVCSLCSASSMVFPGIKCLGSEKHFTCESCLVQHARTTSGERVCCPAPGCTCRDPWPFAFLARHIPDDTFNDILQEGHKKREAALRDREQQMETESSVLRAHHEAALRERERELATVRQREHKLQEERNQLAQRSHPWTLPSYWSPPPEAPQRWRVVPVSNGEFGSLAGFLAPGGTLGGRDMRLQGGHKGFRLGAAWRIENQALFTKYAVEKERLRGNIAALEAAGKVTPKVKVREQFSKTAQKLPGTLDSDLNEVYLTHGTKPETVLSVISGGLNERFSGGLFGHGTYFAEDVAKNDQYVTEDTAFGNHRELHAELYDNSRRSVFDWFGGGEQEATSVKHPGKVFYVFVCRVTLGHYCRTQNASTNMDAPAPAGRPGTGTSIWSSEKRELAPIPGSMPPEPFHGLVAETGGIVQRFREFMVFHGDRIYPEYLLAYQRV